MGPDTCTSFPGLGIMVALFSGLAVQLVALVIFGVVAIVNAVGDFGLPDVDESKISAALVFGPAVAAAGFVLVRTFWMMLVMSSRRVATPDGKAVAKAFHELPMNMKEDYEFRRMTELVITRMESMPEKVHANMREDLGQKWKEAGLIFADKITLEDQLSEPDSQLDMYISSTRDSVALLDNQVKEIPA